MPVSGGPARQLTDGKATGRESWFPSWSPDGRELAFSMSQDVTRNIYVMPRVGGSARQITKRPEQDWRPVWSPDGESLVFDSNGFLWKVVLSAGGEVERLTDGSGFSPRWSRDGREIFFIGIRERSGNVWALSLEDKSEHPLTNLVGKRGSVGYGLATDHPYIYFNWSDNLGDIWVMDVVTDESE